MIRGGGKRARVSVADLRPMENDPQIIQAFFTDTSFNFESFIGSMDRSALVKFIGDIEKNRTITLQVQTTVDNIPAFKSAKD